MGLAEIRRFPSLDYKMDNFARLDCKKPDFLAFFGSYVTSCGTPPWGGLHTQCCGGIFMGGVHHPECRTAIYELNTETAKFNSSVIALQKADRA